MQVRTGLIAGILLSGLALALIGSRPASDAEVASAPSAVASDMFIKIGDIKGESTDDGHKDWINLDSWSWGAMNNADAATGRQTGRAAFGNLMVVKQLDRASPLLMEACADGRTIPEVQLVVYAAGATGGRPLLTITLTNVQVVSTTVTAERDQLAQNQGRPTEEVTLNYGKIEYAYDSPSFGRVEAGWDVVANKKV